MASEGGGGDPLCHHPPEACGPLYALRICGCTSPGGTTGRPPQLSDGKLYRGGHGGGSAAADQSPDHPQATRGVAAHLSSGLATPALMLRDRRITGTMPASMMRRAATEASSTAARDARS